MDANDRSRRARAKMKTKSWNVKTRAGILKVKGKDKWDVMLYMAKKYPKRNIISISSQKQKHKGRSRKQTTPFGWW